MAKHSLHSSGYQKNGGVTLGKRDCPWEQDIRIYWFHIQMVQGPYCPVCKCYGAGEGVQAHADRLNKLVPSPFKSLPLLFKPF